MQYGLCPVAPRRGHALTPLPFLGVSSLLRLQAARSSRGPFFRALGHAGSHIAVMRRPLILLATIFTLSLHAGARADEIRMSCAELAERRAERQYAEDSAALEARQAGQTRDSALQRDFLRLDAESYRTRVYEDCLRLRGGPEPVERPAPTAE
jgi:hypothetical protein